MSLRRQLIHWGLLAGLLWAALPLASAERHHDTLRARRYSEQHRDFRALPNGLPSSDEQVSNNPVPRKRGEVARSKRSGMIAVSIGGLKGHFADPRGLAQRISSILPDLQIYPELTFTYRKGKVTITFKKGLRARIPVWQFPETDVETIERFFGGISLVRAQRPGMLTVSPNGLRRHFVNLQKLTQRINAILPDVQIHPAPTFTYRKGKLTITFEKGLSERIPVWRFPEAEIETLEALFGGISLARAQRRGMIALSAPSLRTHFTNAQVLAQRINAILPDVQIHPAPTFTYRKGKLTITFEKGLRGSQPVWRFPEAEIETLEALFGGINLARAQRPSMLVISADGIQHHFVNPDEFAQRITARLPDVQTYPAPTFTYRKGQLTITFEKGVSGRKSVWRFPEAEVETIERLFGGILLTHAYRPKMIAVSSGGLHAHFVDARGLGQRIDKVLPDVQTHSAPTFTYRKGKLTITFEKGLRGPSLVWRFPEAEIETIETLFRGVSWTRVKRPGMLVVSQGGLEDHFVNPANLAPRITASLPDVQTYPAPTFTYRKGELAITFEKGIGARRPIWRVPEAEVRTVATMFEAQLRPEVAEMEVEAEIERLGLEEVIALLGQDPLRFMQYLRLYHPELAPEAVERIARRALRGLRAEPGLVEELFPVPYPELLPRPQVMVEPPVTEGYVVTIRGQTQPGIPYIQVFGMYTRQVRAKPDGKFETHIPLPRMGEVNEFHVYAFNPETEQRSTVVDLQVQQTSERVDVEEAFLRLLALRDDLFSQIQQEPERYAFLLRSVEYALLRHFTYREAAGFRDLRRRIREERSPVMRALLQAILAKFETIQREITERRLNIKPDQRLYFFQKYTIYEVQQLMRQGVPGIVIAHEQGLGKTIAALGLLQDREAVIITPNPVVSTWLEQEELFLETAHLQSLEGTYVERERTLTQPTKPQVLFNVEFTRNMTPTRALLLARPEGVLVIDEGDYLVHPETLQTQGTHQIQAPFKLLLTATPFREPSQINHLLGFLRPDDPRFRSRRAFERAFRPTEPERLNALFLLIQQHTLRLRKQDLFEEYDPNVPLERQSDRLPRKVEQPPVTYELTDEQMESIRLLFTDYEGWVRQHREQAMAQRGEWYLTDEDRLYARRPGYFSRRHVLRQIMNDPAYIDRPDLGSPKHQAMDRIVEQELGRDPTRKIVIFTEYRAQVEEYVQRYTQYGALAYYGGLSANRYGYKIDEHGRVLYYRVDEYGNYVLDDPGRPIETDREHGQPIRALDYQRLLFQNDPSSRILVATYKTGGLGVNLTAADVVVFDDLAPTYRDQYQAGDRAHRIDNQRKKYTVTYYWLQARYPQRFLRQLPEKIRSYYFAMGTFDEVHFENIQRQGRIFHRIMDGIGSEEELRELSQRFLRERMPFMFIDREPELEEEAEAPPEEPGADAPEDPEPGNGPMAFGDLLPRPQPRMPKHSVPKPAPLLSL